MKLKKQFKIFIIIFIILVNIFAIKDTSELLSKLELNTIAICDAQAFVDLNVTLQIEVANCEEFDYYSTNCRNQTPILSWWEFNFAYKKIVYWFE